jgi:hypothetical protein
MKKIKRRRRMNLTLKIARVSLLLLNHQKMMKMISKRKIDS